MSPGQRLVLEVGYTAFMQAGHTRASLDGENIGVFLGDVGMDWQVAAAEWSTRDFGPQSTLEMVNESINVGVTSNRLSHILNLIGPTMSVDTACSASLVALQSGHKQMMHWDTDENKRGATSAPHSIAAGGINTLLTPLSYIANCAAGMLSHVGRCWTFDRTADGYQRGEGCAAVVISPQHTPADATLALAGSAVN
jgi:acyl transferase domain-containing protein